MNRSHQLALLLTPLMAAVGCQRLVPRIADPDPERIEQLAAEQQQEERLNQPPEPAQQRSAKLPSIKAYPDWSLRETAADALGRIGAPAVPELIESLRNRDPRERQRAARVLARIGPDAVDAVPMLTAALRDPDPFVQKTAARALGQIGPDAAVAVPELVELFNAETSDN